MESQPTPESVATPTPNALPVPMPTPDPTQSAPVVARPWRVNEGLPCDENGPTTLPASPLDPAVVANVTPLGQMAGSHVTPTDHLYISHDRPNIFPPSYDVVSPADGQIVRIGTMSGYLRAASGGQGVIEDFRMIIEHSCTLFTIFIHVGTLDPEVLAVTGEIPVDGRGWYPSPDSPPVQVMAGQPVAKVGEHTFDFSLHDADVVLDGFVSPERYAGESWKIHTVDPFDYFEEPARTQLLGKNLRTAEPRGGKIDYDIDGRLVGNWFLDGVEGYAGAVGDGLPYWAAHLTIAYDHFDPAQLRVSIGAQTGIDESGCSQCGNVYAVAGNGPDPADISIASGEVKYELLGRVHVDPERVKTAADERVRLGVILAQMLDDRTIKVEVFPGVTPGQVAGFTEAASIYRR